MPQSSQSSPDLSGQWQALSQPQRDQALARMSPEQKQELAQSLGFGAAHTPLTEFAHPSDTPTFVPGAAQRVGQALGIPTSRAELAMKPTTGETVAEGVGGPGGRMAYDYARNLGAEGSNLIHETRDAIGNIVAGQPAEPNIVGKMGSAGAEFLLRGVLGPVGGDAVMTGGEDVASGNTAGAAGDVIGATINLLLLGKANPDASFRPGAMESRAVNKLSFAAGGYPEQIKATIGDIKQTMQTNSLPPTVQGLYEGAQITNRNLSSEYGTAMQALRSAHPNAPTIGVVQALLDKANSIPPGSSDALAMRGALRSKANEYAKGSRTWESLDHDRSLANDRLDGFFKKKDAGQYAPGQSKVGTLVDHTVADAIRDTIYPAADQALGKPSGYFRDLKLKQKTLGQLQEQLHDRIHNPETGLIAKTALAKGKSRFSQENVSVYGHPGGSVGTSIHRLQDMVIRPNPLKSADNAVRKGLGGSTVGSKVAAGAVAAQTYSRARFIRHLKDSGAVTDRTQDQ